jgi:hypothetical protein
MSSYESDDPWDSSCQELGRYRRTTFVVLLADVVYGVLAVMKHTAGREARFWNHVDDGTAEDAPTSILRAVSSQTRLKR